MSVRMDFSPASLYSEPTLFGSLEPAAELQDRQWLTQTRNGVSKDMTPFQHRMDPRKFRNI